MKNTILRYGTVGGIVSIALGLLNWFTVAQSHGPSISQAIGYLTIIIALLCIPLGITYFRDQINNGSVTFREGFLIGLGITSIFSVLTFFYSLIFFTVAGDQFVEWNKRFLSDQEWQEWQQRVADLPSFAMSAWFQSLVLVISIFIIGIVINLISSTVLKSTASH